MIPADYASGALIICLCSSTVTIPTKHFSLLLSLQVYNHITIRAISAISALKEQIEDSNPAMQKSAMK